MAVIGGDDIVNALQEHLRKELPGMVERLGLDELGTVQTWQVLPDPREITAARHPAVSVVAAEAEAVERDRDGYSASWSASVGVFDRGADFQDTQNRIQRWAKAIRATALLGRCIPGTPFVIRWAGETSDLIPASTDNRTLAGAEVMFDVFVENALDLGDIRNPAAPPLLSTHHTIQPR